jgi:hypothetical protein
MGRNFGTLQYLINARDRFKFRLLVDDGRREGGLLFEVDSILEQI